MKRLSLVAKNTLFVGVLVVITAGTVSWAGYEHARAIMHHQIKNRLSVVANDRRTILLNALHAHEQVARGVAGSARVRELALAGAAGKVDEARQVLFEARAAAESVLEITLVDASGKVVGSTTSAKAGEDVARSPAYLAGKLTTRVSPPVVVGGEYHALLSCPVRGPSGAVAGVVIATIDMTPTMDALADTTGLGDTGEVLIGTRSGDRIAHVLLSRAGDAIADAPLERSPAIARALSGQEGMLELLDYRGAAAIAAYRPIGYPGWGIAVKIDRAEADAPVAALRARVLWLDARILLAALVLSYLLAARTTRPVLELAATAKAVASGEFEGRVPVRTDDEIGALARAFNDMSDKLARSYATLEERVEARTRELARSNAELEQFAYVASHDLQEPLRMVASYTQLLSRRYRGRLDADADEFIAYAVDGAQRMQRLIADLLTFSKLGRQEVVRERTDMRAVVDAALANLRAAVAESNARITVGTLPELEADAQQLVPLFQNLIGNALKYSGGRPPVVDIEAAAEADGWRFTVRDHGIGLEPQFAERIFVIFQRLHTREEYPGTGIGLAICKQIVERHGGRIWVESKAGKGAAFHFTIPAVREPGGGSRA